MPRLSHSFRFDYPHNIGWGVQIIKLLIMYFSPFRCYLVPLRPNNLNTLFWNILSLCSCLSISDQFLHSYKTTDKIIVLCILIFKFLNSKLENKIFCTEWSRRPIYVISLSHFTERPDRNTSLFLNTLLHCFKTIMQTYEPGSPSLYCTDVIEIYYWKRSVFERYAAGCLSVAFAAICMKA
jgi:hypothetical protein